MRLTISPVVLYAVGIMLMVFGALRAKYLAAPRPPREVEDGSEPADATPVRGKEQRRHLRMGVVWILLGLFLVVSTYWQAGRL